MLLAVSYGRNLHHGTWQTLQGRARYKPPAQNCSTFPHQTGGQGLPRVGQHERWKAGVDPQPPAT